MVENINRFLRASRKLMQELGREPTPEEVAKALGIEPDKALEIIKISQEPASLESPVGDEEDSRLAILFTIRRRRRFLTRPQENY